MTNEEKFNSMPEDVKERIIQRREEYILHILERIPKEKRILILTRLIEKLAQEEVEENQNNV